MNLQQYKFVFIAIGLIGVLLIASPVFADVISFPSSEHFSELYILGPNKMASDLPFNIVTGQNYTIYLGIGNHLESSTYYVCYIKLRNQTESFPNENKLPSSLSHVYERKLFIQYNSNYTIPLTFLLSNFSISNNQFYLESLVINNEEIKVNKIANFDQENNGYYFMLFIELWVLNPQSESLEYQQRYVFFWLNVTPAFKK